MKITISYTQTLDGRLATRTGDSQWIGGPESLRLAHRLRATHDAVLVGVGTVVADNPRLTTRLVEGRSPLRVVLDSTLRIPAGSNVLQDGAANTLVVTTDRASHENMEQLRGSGVQLATAKTDANRGVDVHDAVRLLEARGIQSLLVEGGAATITSMLRAGLCDRVVVSIAPRILGRGIEAIGDLGIDRLRDSLQLVNASINRCGEDLIVDGEFARVASVAG